VFGSADESVDSAPTHQVLLDEDAAAGNVVATGAIGFDELADEGRAVTKMKAPRNNGITASDRSLTW